MIKLGIRCFRRACSDRPDLGLRLGRCCRHIDAPDGWRAYVAVGPENGVALIDLKTLAIPGHFEAGLDLTAWLWPLRINVGNEARTTGGLAA